MELFCGTIRRNDNSNLNENIERLTGNVEYFICMMTQCRIWSLQCSLKIAFLCSLGYGYLSNYINSIWSHTKIQLRPRDVSALRIGGFLFIGILILFRLLSIYPQINKEPNADIYTPFFGEINERFPFQSSLEHTSTQAHARILLLVYAQWALYCAAH